MSVTTQTMNPSQEAPATVAHRRRDKGDKRFARLTGGFALIVAVTLFAILMALVFESWPVWRTFGPRFLWDSSWDAVAGRFGALPFIYGTLVSSAIALLLATPVSFAIAVFLSELSPRWLRQPLATTIELLAGIPSIVYGMWGLLVFAPWFARFEPVLSATLGQIPGIGTLFRGPPLGIGLLTAGIVLAVMILPFISSIMRDVFLLTPAALKESAYALGATRWEVVRRVVLPYTRSAVIGGIFLGLGRALGETMAVTFIIGNTNEIPPSLLLPGASIASVIANEFTEAVTELHRASLLALGLVLFLITFVVLALAKLLLLRLDGLAKGKPA